MKSRLRAVDWPGRREDLDAAISDASLRVCLLDAVMRTHYRHLSIAFGAIVDTYFTVPRSVGGVA